MDRFASLSAFVRVVEENGFAAAARSLGLSRSQVNKLVIGLEDHLGAQLLNRTTRKVSPTSAGLALYDRARSILDDWAEAESAFHEEQDDPQGDFRINAPMSFGTLHLSSAIADFMARHPKIRVELILNDRQVDPVADGFDMTIRIGEPIETLALIDHRIVVARRVICAAPEFLSAHGTPSTIDDLKSLPALYYGAADATQTWRLVLDGKTHTVKIKSVMSSNNGEVLRDAALRGLGVTELPTFIVGADLQSGRLVSLLPGYEPAPLEICLLYPPNRRLSSRIKLFVEFFHERFAARPYWDLVD
ncbi:MAG: LysR family transcriptional regulator [Pseudomonadota bacterium]